MMITPAALDAAFYSFKMLYDQAYGSTETFWQMLATLVPSSTRENRYPWQALIPAVREWLGERYVHNLALRNYSLVNKDWELTIGLDRNDFEDDQLGVYAPTATSIGEQMKKLRDQRLAEVMEIGYTTAGICFDGQQFFDSDHPVNLDDSAAGTYSNRFDSSTSGALPLTHANVSFLRKTMRNYKGEDGKPLGIRPRLLIVDTSNETIAHQICKDAFIAPTSALGANAASIQQSNTLQGQFDYLVVDRLTDEGRWYLADVSKPIKPFIWQNRKDPEFVQLTRSDDPDVFKKKQYLMGSDARGEAGYTLPFLIATAK